MTLLQKIKTTTWYNNLLKIREILLEFLTITAGFELRITNLEDSSFGERDIKYLGGSSQYQFVLEDKTKRLIVDGSQFESILNKGVFTPGSTLIIDNSTGIDFLIAQGDDVLIVGVSGGDKILPFGYTAELTFIVVDGGGNEVWQYNVIAFEPSTASDTFTSQDGKTITVVNGVITAIV
jgi:hypothetical protein